MTDKAQKPEQSKHSDEALIGWRVYGEVSGQEQRTTNVSAGLNFNRPARSANVPPESRQDSSIAEEVNHETGRHLNLARDLQPNYNLADISLARAIGQSTEDAREISDLLWNEMRVSEDSEISTFGASVRARISNEVDPSWAQSLLYEAEDHVSLDRDILVSRPIVSDTSGILSLVLSETIETKSTSEWISATGSDSIDHNGSRKWSRLRERRAATDIGFCTIEVKLLPHDGIALNDRSALSLLDPRRSSPIRKDCVGVNFNIVSLYLHPDYRKRGLGRLLAHLAKTFIIYVVDELVDQISYRDYVVRAQSRESNSPRTGISPHPSTGSELDIVVCGTSVDQRSDRVFSTILAGVLAEFGGDCLSSASPIQSAEASRLRSFALVCDKIMSANPSHRESEFLASILRTLGNMHSFHPRRERPSPWGKVTTTTVDLVDWRADR